MPILWALAGPKLDEREVLAAMLEVDAQLVRERPDRRCHVVGFVGV